MTNHSKKNSRLVYSTETGRIRPEKEQEITQTESDGIVRVLREKKGRGGKVVTVIKGVPVSAEALKALAKQLKQKCGVGGAVKSGNIEIQGDQLALLLKELKALGFKAKHSGG